MRWRELLCLFALSGVAWAANAPDPDAVEAVVSGQRAEANAAWWGFDAEDATESLQAAIDSGAKRVVVPYMGKPWIVLPIKLRSGLELVFEPGVVVLAKRGEFKGKGDSLFSAQEAHDLTLRGYGATLRMWKKDYASDAYEKAEWRMGLSLQSCTRVKVLGLRIESSGGDGIYIGVASEEQPYCKDVVIRDVVCHDHHRQGISVISAEDLLIENCVLSNTGGTAPEAGIDLEPNRPNERLINCVIRNCTMSGNTGAGILVYLKPLTAETKPVSILFEDCLVRGGEDEGIGVGAIKDDGPGGTLEFRNCVVEGAARGGFYVYDKSKDSALVRFANCHWKDVGLDKDRGGDPAVPLLTHLRRPELVQQQGGIEFVDCHVYDSRDRPAFVFDKDNAELGLYNVKGHITVHNPHGARIDLGPEQVDVDVAIEEVKK